MRALAGLGFAFAATSFLSSASAAPMHGIAMQGEPALPADFDHLPYANPDAPQGGTMRYGVFGTFDNLNPVIVKGALTTARGIWFDKEFGNLVFEPLMTRSADEPFTMYGLLAESVETDADRSFVEFTLNPKARFSDGKPVRPEDVLFTVRMMREYGRPFYANWLRPAVKIEKVGEHGVRFTFDKTATRETPLLISGLPVLPEHAFDEKTFDRTTLEPVIGSGPYRVAKVEPGQRITYEKNPEYWAKDLPVRKGINNYDRIIVEYFRDANAQFEAFKKGLFYAYADADPNHWRTAYDFPAVARGDVIRESFQTGAPKNMLAFIFNTRRPVFQDPGVRRALAMLFDFEWANKNLYYGAYQRTASFFQGSALSAIGKPADAREQAILKAAGATVDKDVLDGSYRPPETNGSGSDRTVLKEAVDRLRALGYRFEAGRLVNKDGKPLTFEVIVQSMAQQKIALAYKRTLDRVGIGMNIRLVDDAQYQSRKQTFDYDMLLQTYTASLSPGTEQTNRFGSASRDAAGSFNYAGVADPAVDALIETITSARTPEDFEAAARAYDRVLISGHYVVPLFHIPELWLARWSFIKHPETTPLYGYQFETFWREPASAN
nr:extracellular solute-binding protein [Mangrovicella endophytica]